MFDVLGNVRHIVEHNDVIGSFKQDEYGPFDFFCQCHRMLYRDIGVAGPVDDERRYGNLFPEFVVVLCIGLREALEIGVDRRRIYVADDSSYVPITGVTET